MNINYLNEMWPHQYNFTICPMALCQRTLLDIAYLLLLIFHLLYLTFSLALDRHPPNEILHYRYGNIYL